MFQEFTITSRPKKTLSPPLRVSKFHDGNGSNVLDLNLEAEDVDVDVDAA
jgi:hypothetical protein